MQLIKPSEISSKIMTLIEESESKVIFVSPYVKISKWYKLKNKIENSQKKNIQIEFYIREDKENILSITEVEKLGIVPILVPNLHSKLYMNENYAIITSMNLLLSSEINSLEIGYVTETIDEYNDVLEYYQKHLSVYKTRKENCEVNLVHWLDLIVDELDKKCKELYIDTDEGGITIKTGINTYRVFFYTDHNKNILRISGILSGKQYDALSTCTNNLEKEIGLKIITQRGAKGYYDLIWGESIESYSNSSIHNIKNDEARRVSNEVKKFILTIDAKKTEIW